MRFLTIGVSGLVAELLIIYLFASYLVAVRSAFSVSSLFAFALKLLVGE